VVRLHRFLLRRFERAPYIENGKTTYDNADGLKVAVFINRMYEQGWTGADFDAGDPLVSGMAAGAVHGPWDVGTFQQMYPQTMKNIVIGPIISDVEPEAHRATFADSKGIVIFKSSKVKEQAFAFISWVLSDEQLNLLWLQKTGMMPARDDLLRNPVFADFFNTHAAARVYATYVDVAAPPALNENTIDIQKVMTQELMGPLVYRTKSPDKRWMTPRRRLTRFSGYDNEEGLHRKDIRNPDWNTTCAIVCFVQCGLLGLSVCLVNHFIVLRLALLRRANVLRLHNLTVILRDPVLGRALERLIFSIYFLIAFVGSLICICLKHVGRGKPS
jgi:hypothetical protein